MSSYRHALYAARTGSTISRAGRIVRFLTAEEAESILLERAPRRVHRHVDGEPQFDAAGAPIIDAHAPKNIDARKLGLFVIALDGPPTEFRPTDEEIVANDWELPEGFELPAALTTPPAEVVVEAQKSMAELLHEDPEVQDLLESGKSLVEAAAELGREPFQLPESAGFPPAVAPAIAIARSMFGNPPPPPPPEPEPPELHVIHFPWKDSVKFNDDMAEWLEQMKTDGTPVKLHGSTLSEDSIEVRYSFEK